MRSFIKNASAFLPRRAGCEAPSYLRGCDPPCLSMRNNAPVEHCVAEALISDAGLQPMSEPNFTLRIHLITQITRILRQRLILHRAVLVILIMRYARKVKLVFIYSALRIYVKSSFILLYVSTSNASRPFFPGSFASPCSTKCIVIKAAAIKTAA